jgi:hypothetical protein
VRIECDTKRVQAEAAQHDFLAMTCASSSKSKQLINLSQTLEECQILLYLQEMDLEVQVAILAEEQARGPTSIQWAGLLVEIEEIHAHVDRVEAEVPPRLGNYHS